VKMAPDFQKDPKPLIIPIFIMGRGCPQRCIFCNQNIAAGYFVPEITLDRFNEEVAVYLHWNRNKSRPIEIAFYGGSFTALKTDEQKRLLEMAQNCLRNHQAGSIRISTRPDNIDDTQLRFLRSWGVQTVEIGAQSLNDEVLRLAGRGHDAAATVKAMKLLQEHHFQTGLHLMAGLPGDSRFGFYQTLLQAAELKPDTARIHPVLVLQNTRLFEKFQAGHYHPLSLEEAVDWCRLSWDVLTPAGIRIIRFGLQISQEMCKNGAVPAGPLHPSFGSLVYSSIFYSATLNLLNKIRDPDGELRFCVARHDISNFRGYQNSNINSIKKLYPRVRIVIDSNHDRVPGRLTVNIGPEKILSADIPEI